MLTFVALDSRVTPDHLGLIPQMLNENDPDGAVQQLNKHYTHGGGWHQMEGFKRRDGFQLYYPGDPTYRPLAYAVLHDKEVVVLYEHALVAVFTKGRKEFEAAFMD